MKTYIALFRGINVSGNRVLPMNDLKLAFEQSGCGDVRTYIQSGNVVFHSQASDIDAVGRQVNATLLRRRGFEPRMLLLTRRDLARAVAGNPFEEAERDPKSVHLFFLAETPSKPDLSALAALKGKDERFVLTGKVFYLHTPSGFGTSKLAARAERLLGVEATARNWRTVRTLLEMTNAPARRVDPAEF